MDSETQSIKVENAREEIINILISLDITINEAADFLFSIHTDIKSPAYDAMNNELNKKMR